MRARIGECGEIRVINAANSASVRSVRGALHVRLKSPRPGSRSIFFRSPALTEARSSLSSSLLSSELPSEFSSDPSFEESSSSRRAFVSDPDFCDPAAAPAADSAARAANAVTCKSLLLSGSCAGS